MRDAIQRGRIDGSEPVVLVNLATDLAPSGYRPRSVATDSASLLWNDITRAP